MAGRRGRALLRLPPPFISTPASGISGAFVQQRQLRLGDILDDYCPRERRVTNHAVVAMVGDVVKQTRCATCETEHEYKHAKVPRQRRKDTPAALYAQVLASGPKRVVHEGSTSNGVETSDGAPLQESADAPPIVADVAMVAAVEAVVERADADQAPAPPADQEPVHDELVEREEERDEKEGPVHRPLIRASLPRIEGQQPPSRPIPEFTIRQPGGRPNRFRPRPPYGGGGGGQQFQGNRSNGGNTPGGHRGGGGMRSNSGGGGRPPQGGMPSRMARRHGPGRKRSK